MMSSSHRPNWVIGSGARSDSVQPRVAVLAGAQVGDRGPSPVLRKPARRHARVATPRVRSETGRCPAGQRVGRMSTSTGRESRAPSRSRPCRSSSPVSKVSSLSRRRSPSRTGTADRCATAAWTSRSWSAGSRTSNVWGLLVDGSLTPACRRRAAHAAGPLRRCTRRRPGRRGDPRARVGVSASCSTSPEQARIDLGRTSATALSFVAQSARGLDLPAVPQARSTGRARSSRSSWSSGAATPTRRTSRPSTPTSSRRPSTA